MWNCGELADEHRIGERTVQREAHFGGACHWVFPLLHVDMQKSLAKELHQSRMRVLTTSGISGPWSALTERESVSHREGGRIDLGTRGNGARQAHRPLRNGGSELRWP